MAVPDKEVPRISVLVFDGVSQRKTTQELRLPAEWRAKLAAAAVARKFEHPLSNGAGQDYDYRLSCNGQYLDPERTLAEAGLKPGSTLILTYNPTAAENGA
jgi:hypothetical protein